jgi:hypothetical protein
MIIKKFESYSEDEGVLFDIFSGLEESFNVSVDVKKIFLSLKWHAPVWNGWDGNPSFYDILRYRQS